VDGTVDPGTAATRRFPSLGWDVLLALCAGFLFLLNLGGQDLWASHEARAAQDAQRLLDDGHWALPRLFDGQSELQKPPGYYWLVAAVAQLDGGSVDAWAVRLPAAVTALLTLVLVWWDLQRAGRPVAAVIAVTVLGTAIHFVTLARTGRIDMPLTCAVAAAMLIGCPARAPSGRSSLLTALPLGIVFGIALLLKGPIGVVLPCSSIAVWKLIERRQPAARMDGSIRWSSLAVAIVIGMALALPWYLWANAETDGEFFRVFFIYHHFNRAFGGAPTLAGHPWWSYLPRFAADFLPWTPGLLVALVVCFRSDVLKEDRLARFGLLWLLVMMVILSCSRFKRADYLLPAFPGAAVFLGCIGERWYAAVTARARRFARAGFGLVLVGSLAGWWIYEERFEPRQAAVHEQRAFADYIRDHCPTPQTVLLFRVESHLLAFHLGRPLHTLVEWGELNDLLAEPGTHYFVTRAEFVPECLRNVRTRRLELIARSEDFSTLPPLRPLVLMRTAPPTPAFRASRDLRLSPCRGEPPRD
jgi:4-amino-4-deoxy-L-arabinose transferase-like glycosyltransferase